MKRISLIGDIKVHSITSASQLMVGDANCIKARTKGIAVQRQVAVFFKHEANFEDYPIFTKAVPSPSIDEEKIRMHTDHQVPYIKIGSIHVIGVAAASTMQLGSTRFIDAESRIKHFRQFVT